jgi:hypothetical protein
METELLTLLAEMQSFQVWHPVEAMRIAMIERIIRMVCQSTKIAVELETELRAAEAKYDREQHARKVTKVSRW